MSDATPTPPTPEQPATPPAAGAVPPPAPGAVPPPAQPAAPAYSAPAAPGYTAPAAPGYAQPAPGYAPAAPVKQALSLTGFILGIGSIVFSWAPVFGILVGVAGLIIALIARGREPQAPNWMKMLGLILSIVGIVLGLLFTFLELILPLILFAGAASSVYSY
jgi:hypothetical protein